MVDLSQTIAPKSDQLNAEDLLGGSRVVTITKVSANTSSAEQPISIFYEGDNNRPWKPCKTMRKLLVHVWGANGAEYVGRSLELYNDPTVKWGGLEVGGIRISHMSHIDKPVTVALTATRGSKKPITVKPLQVKREPVNQTVTPAELSVDERVNRFAKEFGVRLGKGPFSEFDDWWKSQEEVRKLVPEERMSKIEDALVKAIDGGWV
jgi:hypothetical protein